MSQDLDTDQQEEAPTSLSRLQWCAFSVPLFLKIFGVVLLVSSIFSGVVYFQVRANIRHAHQQMHFQSATRAATSLASGLEHQNLSSNAPLINEAIAGLVKIFPDVSYVLVLDAGDRVLAHHFSFPMEIPPDLPDKAEELCSTCHDIPDALEVPSELLELATASPLDTSQVRRFARSSLGTILEVTAPIPGSGGGVVRVGHSDASISREMATIMNALIRSLLICVAIGQGLALVLTYLLVHPILNLVQATNALAAGDFRARARVYSADEIGRLARAFNRMAAKLEVYQTEVDEKEAYRASLIDQIVQAQEEERLIVARELHDQLGQSLYKVLLLFRNLRSDCNLGDSRWDKLEEDICGLIDDVRRLAWGIRPSVLDDFGLDAALHQYVKETSGRAGIPIDYQCGFPAGVARLPNRLEVILYRVAQEAITNVVRHANANRASVILLRYDSEVTLLVEDDGQGFDTQSVFQSDISSLGLTGMKERVVLAGGDLTIDSQQGRGAAVRVRIPLRNTAECQFVLS